MNGLADSLKTAVIEYCSTIGADPLLVQGAGGNVSWKNGDTLWVKASGTWLAEAAEKNIFVPVDLQHLRTAIKSGNFSVTPQLQGASVLRPSIETLLHALMPHRVVVHLHAIEILAHLVRDGSHVDLQSLLGTSVHWTMVDYYKPGVALANAVNEALDQKPSVDVIFLKNHGVVIGGVDVAEVSYTLNILTTALSTTPTSVCSKPYAELPNIFESTQYIPVQDIDIHQLAINTDLFNRLDSDWALCPDHVVFLGAQASVFRTWGAFREENMTQKVQPELVFILGEGVFVKSTFSEAQHAQLRCYYDLLVRQNHLSSISILTDAQIAELLNWDAEQYRMNLSK